MNIKDHKFIILGSDHSNTLGQIRCLGEMGIRPIVIITEKNPFIINKSKYIGEYHIVNCIHDGPIYVLEHFSNEKNPPFIYTDRDDTMCAIDDYFDELKGKFFFGNAGEKGRIHKLINKDTQMALAKECGMNIIPTEHVKRGELPQKIRFPIFTKAPNSLNPFWKANAFVCNNIEELENAYKHMGIEEVLLQEFINKIDETPIEGVSIDGGREVVLLVKKSSYRFTPNSFGVYSKVIPFEDNELEFKVQTLMRKANFTGIFEIEFIKDTDGKSYFMEINFRNTQYNHAYANLGINIPYLYAKWYLSNHIDKNDIHPKAEHQILMSELEDFKYSVLKGNLSLWKWLRDFWRTDSFLYIDKHDMMPFFSLLLHKVSTGIKMK